MGGTEPGRAPHESELLPGAPRPRAGELRRAIADGRIQVLFQPQVATVEGRIAGAEALARWDRPRAGEVGADALFVAAARFGLAAPLSELLQRLAFEAAAAWPAAASHLRLSVNVIAEELCATDFADRFLGRAAACGFPADRLTVEVTETGPIADLDGAAAAMARLRDAGCRLAIDDFGAGYSSLAYLSALPLHYLKLDKSLVRGVERDGRERFLLRGVLALARSLDLSVIAEGVETTAQREVLAAEKCELWQGFLCAGAVGTEELTALLRRPLSPARG